MSGHSKWSSIKRKKAVTDSRRSKLWTKLLKEVTVSARLGGGDPTGNSRLRTAVQDARSANVPNDSIDKAIKRGSGELEGVILEETSYEGYGPGGVAVLLEVVTDNKNRTVAELRHLFSRHGGNLGENGCVAWMFNKRGYFAFERGAMSEEELMDLAVEVDAEDFATDDDVHELFVAPEAFDRVRDELAEREIDPASQQLAMIPESYAEVPANQAPQTLRLLEALEDHDDVQHLWANFEFDDQAADAG